MRYLFLSLLVLSVGAPRLVSAGAADPTADWPAVSDSRLDQARGGFDAGNGLLLSLGVERLVSINGNLVASSNFSIADVTKMSAAEARMASDALSAVTVVQNGAGNMLQPDLALQGMGGLLIQNSLNDQMIRSQTTISTTVNSLSMLKNLNFEGSLRDALSSAIHP